MPTILLGTYFCVYYWQWLCPDMMKNGYVNGEHDGKAIESGVASGKSNNKPISVTNHKRGHFTQTYLLVSGVINPHWGWFTIGFTTLRHSRIYSFGGLRELYYCVSWLVQPFHSASWISLLFFGLWQSTSKPGPPGKHRVTVGVTGADHFKWSLPIGWLVHEGYIGRKSQPWSQTLNQTIKRWNSGVQHFEQTWTHAFSWSCNYQQLKLRQPLYTYSPPFFLCNAPQI